MKITRCKLNKKTQRKLLEFFIAEITARTAADLLGIQPNSAALFYKKIRQVIMYHLDQDAIDVLEGQIELDESYFGGDRKGNRGRGTAGKVAVFGMLKRDGKVYVIIVPDTKTATLMSIITRKIAPESIVYTDS
jgi:transposase